MERKEVEIKKFEQLGIVIGSKFEIKELKGFYKIDVNKRVVIDMCDGNKEIGSIYEHLLDGTWHKR